MPQARQAAIVTFGRFNPPTTGHNKLIQRCLQLARSNAAAVWVYPSQSQDAKKNPLPFKTKVRFMRAFWPDVNVNSAEYVRTPIDALADLAARGYTHVIMVVGADRIRDFEKFRAYLVPAKSPKYNRLKHIPMDDYAVVSAGDRDPDADDVSGMSASKMRAFAAAGDFDQFSQGVPSTNRALAMDLYTQVRRHMGIRESRSEFRLPPFQRLLESYRSQMRKEEDEGYQKYFKSMLKKHGYTSPNDIPDEKKDDFFNAVDRGWHAADED